MDDGTVRVTLPLRFDYCQALTAFAALAPRTLAFLVIADLHGHLIVAWRFQRHFNPDTLYRHVSFGAIVLILLRVFEVILKDDLEELRISTFLFFGPCFALDLAFCVF